MRWGLILICWKRGHTAGVGLKPKSPDLQIWVSVHLYSLYHPAGRKEHKKDPSKG
jgi:hypothetical protein